MATSNNGHQLSQHHDSSNQPVYQAFPSGSLQFFLRHPPFGYIMQLTPLTASFIFTDNTYDSNNIYPVFTPATGMPGYHHHVSNSRVIHPELEQMTRRDDSRISDVANAHFEDTEEFWVLLFEILDPQVGNASPGISTPVQPLLDLNRRPRDLNRRPIDLNIPPVEELHLVDYPEEEVAMIHGTLDSELNNLALDYDLTYEEYLELEEQMGRVDSRLSEETIMKHIQITYYTATATSPNEEPDICVICQAEFEDNEFVGGLRCGHEYHVQCIKKWLQQINNCPICKATAVI